MIFRPRQKTLPITRQIILENNVLEEGENTKFLGVYIDQHFDWKTHVNLIAAKISKSVGLLYKAKYYLPCFKVLEYGIHCRTTSKMPRLLVYSSV